MRLRISRRAAVRERDGVEVELKGIAGGAADADIGAETSDDHGLNSPVAQLVGEIRSTEGAVAILGYHEVAILRLESTEERGSRGIGRRLIHEVGPALLFPEGAPPFIGDLGSDEPNEDAQDVRRPRVIKEPLQDLQRMLCGRVGSSVKSGCTSTTSTPVRLGSTNEASGLNVIATFLRRSRRLPNPGRATTSTLIGMTVRPGGGTDARESRTTGRQR